MGSNSNEPVNYDLQFKLTNHIVLFQSLGGAMTGMTNHAKKAEMDDFCSSVQSFSSSVCGLTEASVQVSVIYIYIHKEELIKKKMFKGLC